MIEETNYMNDIAAKKESQVYKRAQEETIAMCLFDDNQFSRISEIVSPEYFLHDKFHHIINSVFNVFRRDQKISIMSVAQDLEDHGNLKFIGGIAELYRLFHLGSKVSLSTTPVVIANIVKEAYVKHEIRVLLTENKTEFIDDSGTTAKSGIEVLQNKLSEYSLELSDDSTSITGEKFMQDYEELLKNRKTISEENKEISGGLQGIPTMLPSLNKYTNGFTEGQLITVGALTGVGKSVFAIMSAIAALKAKKTVMFFTLEMSYTELFDRMVANMAEVKLNNIKSGYISSDEMVRVKEAMITLKSENFIIEADPNITVDSIRSKAIKQQQSPAGLDMIIIDYLQLISSASKYSNRQEIVADISRNMKLMAKTLNIPVMVLVQLNRPNNQKDEGQEELPTLDRIRESGAIAQDSDIVILLHREKKIDNNVPPTLVLLEKNRNGESQKVIPCHTELAYSDFREVKKKDRTDDNSVETGESQEEVEDTLENYYNDELELPEDDDDFFTDEWDND